MSSGARRGFGASSGSSRSGRRCCPTGREAAAERAPEDYPIRRPAIRPSNLAAQHRQLGPKTRISTSFSFAAADRQRNTINPRRCRNSQYRQEMTTRRSCLHPAQRHRTAFPAPTGWRLGRDHRPLRPRLGDRRATRTLATELDAERGSGLVAGRKTTLAAISTQTEFTRPTPLRRLPLPVEIVVAGT